MKVSTALLLLATTVAMASSQETASSDNVKVDFVGASGKMKIYPKSENNNPSTFVMVSQSKLNELDADGKEVQSMRIASGSWSPIEKTGDESFSTTYTTSFKEMTFSLSAHFGVKTSTVVDTVPCNNCTSGEGSCKDQTGACASAASLDTCASNYTLCTATATVKEDELKFSIVVTGWQFLNPSNVLSYGIELESKGDKATGSNSTKPDASGKLALDGGSIVLPTTAVIKGGEADKEIQVQVTTSEVKEGTTNVDFVFPAFAPKESLYYDPDVSLEKANADDASSAEASKASLLGGALLVVAARFMSF